MANIIGDAEELANLTATIAAQNPGLVNDLERFYEAKKAEFEGWAKEKYGAKPEVQPTPHVTAEKSQAEVIADMQSMIQSLQRQLDAAKTATNTSVPIVMEGGEPVSHTLFLDNGTVVQNHAGLATHYSVTVPATATEDEHEEIHKVVAAFPSN